MSKYWRDDSVLTSTRGEMAKSQRKAANFEATRDAINVLNNLPIEIACSLPGIFGSKYSAAPSGGRVAGANNSGRAFAPSSKLEF